MVEPLLIITAILRASLLVKQLASKLNRIRNVNTEVEHLYKILISASERLDTRGRWLREEVDRGSSQQSQEDLSAADDLLRLTYDILDELDDLYAVVAPNPRGFLAQVGTHNQLGKHRQKLLFLSERFETNIRELTAVM
jgi:hypothetical protein